MVIAVCVLGYHGDTSTMVAVGKVDEASQELMEFTKECLDKAIAICGPGAHFGQIGELVETMTIGRGTCPRGAAAVYVLLLQALV